MFRALFYLPTEQFYFIFYSTLALLLAATFLLWNSAMQRICWCVHFLWQFHYKFILNSFELRVENRTQIVWKKWGQSQKKGFCHFFFYSKTWNGKTHPFSHSNTGGPRISWFLVPKGCHEIRGSWILKPILVLNPKLGPKVF